MNVSAEQLKIIAGVIDKNTITIRTLHDDLLDHLCCVVETKMARGTDFEIALNEAVRELAPGGLYEIEKETYLLLNPKILFMKKLIYGSGLIFSIMVTVGFLLKLIHGTGANELMLVGMAGFVIVFLPLLLKTSAGRQTPRSTLQRAKDVLGFMSAFLLSAGGILKIMSVIGANETLLLGTVVFSFGFLPSLFLGMYRKSLVNS
jgi:hypothetical protein